LHFVVRPFGANCLTAAGNFLRRGHIKVVLHQIVLSEKFDFWQPAELGANGVPKPVKEHQNLVTCCI
jgi:hypothetical protein